MTSTRALKHFFNFWIELLNFTMLILIITYSICQINLLHTEMLIPQERFNSLTRSVILFHVLWAIFLVQIPVLLFSLTSKQLNINEYFKFQILKIHWIRTCFSVIFAFLALFLLQKTSGLDLHLSTLKITIISILIIMAAVTGIYFFNKSFYPNRQLTILSPNIFIQNKPVIILLAIVSILFTLFFILLMLA